MGQNDRIQESSNENRTREIATEIKDHLLLKTLLEKKSSCFNFSSNLLQMVGLLNRKKWGQVVAFLETQIRQIVTQQEDSQLILIDTQCIHLLAFLRHSALLNTLVTFISPLSPYIFPSIGCFVNLWWAWVLNCLSLSKTLHIKVLNSCVCVFTHVHTWPEEAIWCLMLSRISLS